jgi:hypothetical protein
MLSDVVTFAALAQQAPALVLAAVALLLALWGYRAARRSDVDLEARLSVSNVRQGKRLGKVEQDVALLDMRRRITEEELAEDGIRLSYWPPDGRKSSGHQLLENDPRQEDFPPDDPDDDDAPLTEARRVPVPPLPPHEGIARHRRSPTP